MVRNPWPGSGTYGKLLKKYTKKKRKKKKKKKKRRVRRRESTIDTRIREAVDEYFGKVIEDGRREKA